MPVKPTGLEIPGIFSISAKLAPTFAFARTDSDLSGVGNTLSATRSTGAMRLTFSNQSADGILRFSIVEMGGFFFPPPGAVRITARATPRVAFSWFLNSEGRRVFTDGFISLHIVGFKGASHHGEARGAVQLWRENRDEGTAGFEFDVSSAAEFPLSTQLKTNNSDFYLISLRCFATHGASHPGKQDLEAHVLGSISAALAAIDLDISMIPQIVMA